MVRARSTSGPIPIPRPTSPPNPHKSISFNVAATIIGALLKVRHAHHVDHITVSSGSPESHPCIKEASGKSRSFELVETWICRDAVEPATLLRATRESLLNFAHQWGKNTLVDEHWEYTICCRRRFRASPQAYRVQVSYSACTAVSQTPDPHKPVALSKVQNVSKCMTILARNPES